MKLYLDSIENIKQNYKKDVLEDELNWKSKFRNEKKKIWVGLKKSWVFFFNYLLLFINTLKRVNNKSIKLLNIRESNSEITKNKRK